jgi:integrase
MAEKITQRTVKNLSSADNENKIIWDSELKGFGVRRTPAGAVSFFLNYRAHGRQRRYKIGRAPEWTAEAARAEAAKIKPRIDSEGYDPLEAKQRARGEPTLTDLADEYIKQREDKSASTKRNDKAAIDTIIKPRLGKLRLAAVNTRDIEGLKNTLQATPYRANRVLALLSHMFSKAMEWKWVKENPVRDVERYQEHRRERWLQDDELKRLHEALDKYSDQKAANALRLIALTGSRKGEVLKATWEEFDLDRGVWTKPSHHTKQKKIEHIPLSEAALTLLRGMKPENATGPVFPGRDGKSARAGLRKPWTAICKAAGLAEAIIIDGKLKGRKLTRYRPLVRVHDLRHTFASHLVSKGTSLHIVGKLIGHTQASTTQRYAHLADSALRDAANNFGNIFDGAKPTLQVVRPRKDTRRKRAAAAE